MPGSYRESHTRPGYGNSYDKAFHENPHRSLVWELEKRALDDILRRFFGARPVRHLDFACGAGRILEHLDGRVESSVGVDISPAMLEAARAKGLKASLVQADLTRGYVLGGARFDLVTAFRFFPNAEEALRREAMAALARHLAPHGYLVFNNHENLSSLLSRLSRLAGRGGTRGMWQAEVDALVAGVGLQIVKVYHIGLMPATEKRLFMPRPLLRAIERGASACGGCRRLSQDLIFVCRHDGDKA